MANGGLIPTAFPCPLDAWMKAEGKSLGSIAESAGIPKPSLVNFRNRKRGLRPATMQKLADSSSGRVTGMQLMFWQNGVDPAAAEKLSRDEQRLPLSRVASRASRPRRHHAA